MASRVREIELSLIRPSRGNPRKAFDAQALGELAASIREVGVIQPIVVIEKGEKYQIVAGERRWRAAKIAGLRTVPTIVRDLNKQEVAKLSLIENFHRKDLNPIEEAQAIDQLIRILRVGVSEVAEMLGKSDAYVYTRRRLLDLPDEIQKEIASSRLSVATANHLTRLDRREEILDLGLAAVRGQLTAYQVECAVRDRLKSLLDKDRSKQREEIYNRKVQSLQEETGKTVVAYNEFDVSKHQRVWNLRFKECKTCPLKGTYLTRDLREEELCLVPSCYKKLETRERSEQLSAQSAFRGDLKTELERVLQREEVVPDHLRLLVFSILELFGPLADDWRRANGLDSATLANSSQPLWRWLSKRETDALITAAIELSVLYLATTAEISSLPKEMIEDLSREFQIDKKLLSRAVRNGSSNGNGTYEAIDSTKAKSV